MQFNLMQNGIDSLRQATVVLDENYLDYEFESFQLKDALFHFVHGTEILSKIIVGKDNEENIFINKTQYRNAKAMLGEKYKNVFEVDPRLKTISAETAVKSLRNQVDMNDKLKNKVIDLIRKRNQLMHFTIEFNEEEKILFTKDLKFCLNQMFILFSKHIPDFKNEFEELERNYPYTEYDRWEDKAIAAAEARHEDGRLGI